MRLATLNLLSNEFPMDVDTAMHEVMTLPAQRYEVVRICSL